MGTSFSAASLLWVPDRAVSVCSRAAVKGGVSKTRHGSSGGEARGEPVGGAAERPARGAGTGGPHLDPPQSRTRPPAASASAADHELAAETTRSSGPPAGERRSKTTARPTTFCIIRQRGGVPRSRGTTSQEEPHAGGRPSGADVRRTGEGHRGRIRCCEGSTATARLQRNIFSPPDGRREIGAAANRPAGTRHAARCGPVSARLELVETGRRAVGPSSVPDHRPPGPRTSAGGGPPSSNARGPKVGGVGEGPSRMPVRPRLPRPDGVLPLHVTGGAKRQEIPGVGQTPAFGGADDVMPGVRSEGPVVTVSAISAGRFPPRSGGPGLPPFRPV